MFRWVAGRFSRLFSRQRTDNAGPVPDKGEPLARSIQANLEKIKSVFSDASDVILREFQIGTHKQTKAFVVFIDGLVDRKIINDSILRPLMADLRLTQPKDGITRANLFTLVEERVLTTAEVREVKTFSDVVSAVLAGDTVLCVDGSPVALVIGTRGWEVRSIEEPDTEAVVRGPREGFTETLRINTAMLRRKIKNPNLKLEIIKIGKQTKTDVCITYIKGIANDKIVEEVRRRLKRIDTDSVLESGYLEEFIEDAPSSIFPTVGNSEKPDVVAAKLLEGRVAILTDGTPFVLTVPFLLVETFQTSEDYYSRPFYVTMVRWLRYTAFFFSIFSPAIYVSVTTFHQEIIPPALLVTMAAAREGTPFPAVVEALGMGTIFEILREAGVRMPRPIGHAVSIVGALVIGEAAVSAGLIGAPMVIVVATTAIASFVVPALIDASAVIRICLTVMAGILGQVGIMLGIAGFLTHMVSLRSFGVPYLSPIAPTTMTDWKDVFIRAPWRAMFTRPRVLAWKNPVRQKFRLKPETPGDEEGSN